MDVVKEGYFTKSGHGYGCDCCKREVEFQYSINDGDNTLYYRCINCNVGICSTCVACKKHVSDYRRYVGIGITEHISPKLQMNTNGAIEKIILDLVVAKTSRKHRRLSKSDDKITKRQKKEYHSNEYIMTYTDDDYEL